MESTSDNFAPETGKGCHSRERRGCRRAHHQVFGALVHRKIARPRANSRLAKLSGGVAVIRVGGSTEVEVKEKKDRVDDAMHATKAAVEERIVPGGGVALLRAKGAIGKLSDENANIQAGINIVLRAIGASRRGGDAGFDVPRLRWPKSFCNHLHDNWSVPARAAHDHSLSGRSGLDRES